MKKRPSNPAKTASARAASSRSRTWNLKLLYPSADDSQMEKDVVRIEKMIADFVARYDTPEKTYLQDEEALNKALTEYESLIGESTVKAYLYFSYLQDIDAANPIAPARLALLESRLAKTQNLMAFFEISIGKIPADLQKKFLESPILSHFKVYLSRIFDDARHMLSVPEEKIINLMSQPAHNMWVSATERILGVKTVIWKKKQIPLPQAFEMVSQLPTSAERRALATAISATLESVAPFAEAEINAIYTDKKIDDELRGYSQPFESTVTHYRNDPAVVAQLVQTVTEAFPISHSFYTLKARLLKQKRLAYSDRAARIGSVKKKFSFDETLKILSQTFGSLNPRFAEIIARYGAQGQIDAFPRKGKTSGAYCSSSYGNPVFVLLNHIDTLNSFTTCAHELGHAFHSELSRSQGPLYSSYSYALAETASTLFETIALDAVYDTLSDQEKISVLHDRINDDISMIFRQIACFNFEADVHAAIRSEGYVSHARIRELHNNNMKAYLGPLFDVAPADGFMFVSWSHIRRFFYVYSYAYGMLVTKALLRRYRADKSFWPSIEKFLSAGGKDSPEQILKEIGIDVSAPEFWKEGLQEIADNIAKLDELTRRKIKKPLTKKGRRA